MNTATQKKMGLTLGLTSTLLVIGLIVYGNLIGKSSTAVEMAWEYRPTLHICDTAPDWTSPNTEEMAKALMFWEDQGWSFANITTGPCPDLCTGRDESGSETLTPCKQGMVALDLFTGTHWEKDHAGVCVMPHKESLGMADWATIMVPAVIYGTEGFSTDAPHLPRDAEALVLAHEIGHCLVGLGHNTGPTVIPGFVTLNSKRGHIMNPNIYKGGWGAEALPAPPESWK